MHTAIMLHLRKYPTEKNLRADVDATRWAFARKWSTSRNHLLDSLDHQFPEKSPSLHLSGHRLYRSTTVSVKFPHVGDEARGGVPCCGAERTTLLWWPDTESQRSQSNQRRRLAHPHPQWRSSTVAR
jgi:hypothetical protein